MYVYIYIYINKEFVRLQLKVTPPVESIAATLETAFRHLDGEQKHGIAPRGPRERELLEGMGLKAPAPTNDT